MKFLMLKNQLNKFLKLGFVSFFVLGPKVGLRGCRTFQGYVCYIVDYLF